MHILFTIPFWVGLAIWLAGMLARHKQQTAARVAKAGPPEVRRWPPVEVLSPSVGKPSKAWLFVALMMALAVLAAVGLLSKGNSNNVAAVPVGQPAPPVDTTHVRLKPGTVLRRAPTTATGAVRTAKPGEVFTKFGYDNHWYHIGHNDGEAWVPEVAISP